VAPLAVVPQEVSASFELFRRMQSIMLDSQGVPYAVRWSPLTGLAKKAKKGHNIPATYVAFLLGIFFASATRRPELAHALPSTAITTKKW
jgi:hypothetical protein